MVTDQAYVSYMGIPVPFDPSFAQAAVLPVQPFRISGCTFVCRLLCCSVQAIAVASPQEAHQMLVAHKTMPGQQSPIRTGN